MRAGRLDRRVTIQRATLAPDAAGQPIETWGDLAGNLAASVTPLSGDERFTAAQWVARQQVEILLRYSSTLADLTPEDRVIYPAPEGSPADPGEGDIYDIMAVFVTGREDGLRILAARRMVRAS